MQQSTEKEENVVENVEGVHNIEEDDNGLNPKADSEDGHINNRLNIDFISPTSNVYDISSLNDDNENTKEDVGGNGGINQPQYILSEPFTPETLIEDWEHLHNTRLSEKLRI